jgi:hypothetical protein
MRPLCGDGTGNRRQVLRLIAPLLFALTLGGCGRRLSEAECGALLDRYTELLVRSDREGTSAGDLHKLQEAARARASRDPDFRACSDRVSRRAFDCAMAAENVDRLEQCML